MARISLDLDRTPKALLALASRRLGPVIFAAALAAPLALRSETMTLNTFYPALLGQYSTVEVEGATRLVSEANTGPDSNLAIGVSTNTSTVNARLTVSGGGITVGGNYSYSNAMTIRNANMRGVGMEERDGSGRWSVVPQSTSNLYFDQATTNRFIVSMPLRVRMCAWQSFPYQATTNCSNNGEVVFGSTSSGGNPARFIDNTNPKSGWMLCCKMDTSNDF